MSIHRYTDIDTLQTLKSIHTYIGTPVYPYNITDTLHGYIHIFRPIHTHTHTPEELYTVLVSQQSDTFLHTYSIKTLNLAYTAQRIHFCTIFAYQVRKWD